jgi:signal transduction histidine kinase
VSPAQVPRPRKRPRPLEWAGRITPQAFIIFAVVLVLGASAAALVVVYRAGERIISERERAWALAERDLFEEVSQEEGRATLVQSVARRARFSAGGERYGLFDSKGVALAGDFAHYDPAFHDADWRELKEDGANGGSLHVVGTTLPDGSILVVGRDQSELQEFERAILKGFGAALSIVLAASLVTGLVLNASILSRVEAIASTAERIAAGDLSARAPLSDTGDPFGRVGSSLNAMLARIEELMTGMRTVTDSLAHDLRSPLTRTRGALARALDPAATEEERLDAIESAHGEVDRTLGQLSAMLDIARAETGLSREMMQPIDLAVMAADVADLFVPTLEDAGQTLIVEPPSEPVVVHGHEALLRQALGNLLHNASLYAGEGVAVRVSFQNDGPSVHLIVTDTGVGVPDDQLGRVQERFVRLDPARAAGGSGLGLAIVAACAKLHGGVLRLSDNKPGLRADMELKRA